MFFGPSLSRSTDHRGVLETQEVGLDPWSRLEAGGWLGSRFRRCYERLEEDFEVREDVFVPEGIYRFDTFEARLFLEGGRKLSGSAGVTLGGFYDGRRTAISFGLRVRPSCHISLESDYEHNDVTLWNPRIGGGSVPESYPFSTNVVNARVTYSFTTALLVDLFARWNDDRNVASLNILLSYEYRPGSNLYLLYGRSWHTSEGRTALVKLVYLWSL